MRAHGFENSLRHLSAAGHFRKYSFCQRGDAVVTWLGADILNGDAVRAEFCGGRANKTDQPRVWTMYKPVRVAGNRIFAAC